MYYKVCLYLYIIYVYERQKHVEFRISGLFKSILCLCIFSDTVCDKGTILKSFLLLYKMEGRITYIIVSFK
jgi:hypothetical protein